MGERSHGSHSRRTGWLQAAEGAEGAGLATQPAASCRRWRQLLLAPTRSDRGWRPRLVTLTSERATPVPAPPGVSAGNAGKEDGLLCGGARLAPGRRCQRFPCRGAW